jgi:HlyD family secretion protein
MKIQKKIIPFVITVLLGLGACRHSSENSGGPSGTGNANQSGIRLPDTVEQVAGLGKVEPLGEIVSLASQSGGIVSKLLKNEGDKVKEGDTILVMDNASEKLKVLQIRSKIEGMRAQLEYDEQAIAVTEAKLQQAQKILQASLNLLKDGAEKEENVNDQQTQVKTLEAGLGQNKASLTKSRADLNELQVELRMALDDLGKKALKAPGDGTLLEISASPGSALSQYQSYADFAPAGPVMVRCEIDELFANRVKTGQSATITLVGSTKVIASGKVYMAAPFLKPKSFFSDNPADKQDRRVREVRILLDNPDDLLYNMQVECLIKTS